MHPRSIAVVFAFLAALALGALPLRAQQETNNGLPPGDGRDIVAATCSQCHALTAITHLREGPLAWRHQIYDMIGRGAQVSPAEIDVMVKYLTTNFGPGIPFPGQTPSHVALTDAPGNTLVSSKCILCHGVDRVIAVNRPRAQWTAIVARMVYLGAALTPDQSKAVVDYLSTNYAPKT
jgi:mono/diheme cytochrome c family protein